MRSALSCLLLFIFFSCTVFSQAPNYLWAKGFGGNHSDIGKSIAVDINGNAVVTGSFKSSFIVFGSDTLFNSGPAGTEDFFLAKFDSYGSVIWAVQAFGSGYIGSGSEDGKGVTLDNSGNITAVGLFYSDTLVFGNDTLLGPGNAFVAHYDANGNELWAKTFSGTFQACAYGVCNDATGNIFFTGYYRGPAVIFDTLSTFPGSTPNNNSYLIKMDPSGNALWRRCIGGDSGADYGSGVACDPAGNIFLTGSYASDSIVIGPDVLYNSDTTAAWYTDVFIAKYDNAGTPLWAKRASSTISEFFASVACDASGNVFLSGIFYGNSIVSGTASIANPYGGTTGAATTDVFIFKYDSSGNVSWGKGVGGNLDEVVYGSTTVDSLGNFYVGVCFESPTITVGATTLTNTGTATVDTYDVFVLKCTSSGTFQWIRPATGPMFEEIYSVAVSPYGRLVFTGGFYKDAVFGSSTVYNFDNATNYSDVFVAAIDNVLVVDEANSPDGISVYPNPFTDVVNISLSTTPKTATQLFVFDLASREVLKKQLTQQVTEIQRGTLSSGIYFYRIIENKKVSTGKIIIQ